MTEADLDTIRRHRRNLTGAARPLLDLDAIRARRAAITCPPWQIHDIDPTWVADAQNRVLIADDEEGHILREPDAAFIAAAPADIDALLARVAALERALEHAVLVIENYEMDIRNSEWTGVNLHAVGFCQGVIYQRALQTIQDLAQP